VWTRYYKNILQRGRINNPGLRAVQTSQQQTLSGQLVVTLARSYQIHRILIAYTGRRIADVTAGTSRYHGTAGLDLTTSLQTRFKNKHLLFTSIPPMEVFPHPATTSKIESGSTRTAAEYLHGERIYGATNYWLPPG